MSKKASIALLVFLAALIGAGFYFKDSFKVAFNNAKSNFPAFSATDIGNVLNGVADQLSLPEPLNIGGNENGVVLTKAKIIAQTNAQRYDHGMLPPLLENSNLDAAAKAKAEDMFKNQYFEHVSPAGVDPGELVKSYGYDYIVSGENLILGNFASEQEVVQRWMDSPGHRANILHSRFVDIGVAIIKGTYQGRQVWIGVQEFGVPLSQCPPAPSAQKKAQIDANKAKLDHLQAQINAKRQEINATSKNSPEYNQRVDEYNVLVGQYNQLAESTKQLISQYNAQLEVFNSCVASSSS